MMLRNKYKLGRNNGLLPRISIAKPPNPIVTSYALLYDSAPRQYEVARNPNNPNSFVLYNDKEYLHRHCSFVSDASKHKQTIKDVSELYPNSNFTLVIFVANEPSHSDQIILGHEKCSSLLTLAFRDLKKKKNHGSKIVFSIVGIENENSLTDQLNFEWIERSKEEFDEQNPIRAIVKHKPKIKISKCMDSCTFVPENLSNNELKSQSNLLQLLARYQQVKNYFEEWVSISDKTEYYSQGELYRIAETEVDEQYGTMIKVVRSHYILRVNQYLKSSAPFMLRLGMNLRRIQEDNSNTMDIHESKIFKLLSECFTSRNDKNELIYRFHHFMQVGLYPTLKEEYLNLAPTSDGFFGKKHMDSDKFQQISFFFIKQYMQYPNIVTLIHQIQAKQRPKKEENLQQYLQNGQQLELRQKLLNKSYVSDTFSSFQKRKRNDRVVTEQTPHADRHLDLEELVHQTAKIYRLDSIKKIKLPDSRNSFALSRKASAKPSLLKMSMLERIPGSTPRISNQAQICKEKHVKKPIDADKIIIEVEKEGEVVRTNKFYSEAKEWLGFVYGPSSKQFKKIKGNLQRNDKSLKKAVDTITRKQQEDQRRENRLSSPKNL